MLPGKGNTPLRNNASKRRSSTLRVSVIQGVMEGAVSNSSHTDSQTHLTLVLESGHSTLLGGWSRFMGLIRGGHTLGASAEPSGSHFFILPGYLHRGMGYITGREPVSQYYSLNNHRFLTDMWGRFCCQKCTDAFLSPPLCLSGLFISPCSHHVLSITERLTPWKSEPLYDPCLSKFS